MLVPRAPRRLHGGGAPAPGASAPVFDVDYPGDTTPFWEEEQISKLAAWLEALPKPIGLMACIRHAGAAAHKRGPRRGHPGARGGRRPRRQQRHHPLRAGGSGPLERRARTPSSRATAPRRCFATCSRAASPKVVRPARRADRRRDPALHGRPRRGGPQRGRRPELHPGAGLPRASSVDQVLQHAHASRSQMERKFRQHIGRSPQAEIRRVQLTKIRQLLLETDFPLKRIAELTGFEHMEYMCVLFKRLTGDFPGHLPGEDAGQVARRARRRAGGAVRPPQRRR